MAHTHTVQWLSAIWLRAIWLCCCSATTISFQMWTKQRRLQLTLGEHTLNTSLLTISCKEGEQHQMSMCTHQKGPPRLKNTQHHWQTKPYSTSTFSGNKKNKCLALDHGFLLSLHLLEYLGQLHHCIMCGLKAAPPTSGKPCGAQQTQHERSLVPHCPSSWISTTPA